MEKDILFTTSITEFPDVINDIEEIDPKYYDDIKRCFKYIINNYLSLREFTEFKADKIRVYVNKNDDNIFIVGINCVDNKNSLKKEIEIIKRFKKFNFNNKLDINDELIIYNQLVKKYIYYYINKKSNDNLKLRMLMKNLSSLNTNAVYENLVNADEVVLKKVNRLIENFNNQNIRDLIDKKYLKKKKNKGHKSNSL